MLSSFKDSVKDKIASAKSSSSSPALTSQQLEDQQEADFLNKANDVKDSTEPPFDQEIALVIGIAARIAVEQEGVRPVAEKKREEIADGKEGKPVGKEGELWVEGVCGHLQLPSILLPSSPTEDLLLPMLPSISPSLAPKITHTLLLSSIFPTPPPSIDGAVNSKINSPQPSESSPKPSPPSEISYTSHARHHLLRTLELLQLPYPTEMLLKEEAKVAKDLFDVLEKSKAEGEGAGGSSEQDEVEKARKEREEGWGGKWGRWAATGAGVVIGSIALGLTGGLAAPAILAILPTTLGILTPATAPILLGGLFGVTGGGLAGRRVRARWAGVSDFEFVEVGKTKAKAKFVPGEAGMVEVSYQPRKKKGAASALPEPETAVEGVETPEGAASSSSSEKGIVFEPSTNSDPLPLPSASKPPSLTVIIALTGLLSEDADEGLRAYERVIASPAISAHAPPPAPPLEHEMETLTLKEDGEPEEELKVGEFEITAKEAREEEAVSSGSDLKEERGERATDEAARKEEEGKELPVKPEESITRGRDVFLAKVEMDLMVSTGKDINQWITHKIKSKIGHEVLKRTFVNAYLSAVALPLTIYGWAGTALDNSWMRAVDKARKAGPLLAEVLLARVQGSRPVILIGSSLGALTVFECLLHLAKEDVRAKYPHALSMIDSVHLISLPTSPTHAQWASARLPVARRMTNAFSPRDFVLASVVRLHEVVGSVSKIGRDGGLQEGVRVAGLGKVDVDGVEDVDLGGVLEGHFELQHKLSDVLRLIDLDK